MTYTIISTIRNNQGEPITMETIMQADTMQDAREQAQATNESAATVRIYPTTTNANGKMDSQGIEEGARLVVRRTTANMVKREGGAIQWELYNAIRCTPVTHESALECINVASLALVEGVAAGLPTDEQYHQAYLALNRYLRSLRAIDLSATAQRTCYIADVGGDIISVNGRIAQIIREGAHYIPQAEEGEEGDQAKLEALQAIIATLAPTQRKIAKYLANGYSVRQICAALHRSPSTIQEHVNAIRRKALALYPHGVR